MNLLKYMKDIRNDYKLVLNIPYHPNVSNLRDNTKTKILKDILVRAKVPQLRNMKVFVDHVKNEICHHIVSTDSLCKQQYNGPYLLYYLPKSLKYSSENVMFLFTCKAYSEQCTESTYAF